MKLRVRATKAAAGWLLLLPLGGCAESPPKVVLRSLQASGEMTALCRSDAGQGVPLSQCPDYEFGRNDLLALVTQTVTDEVALVQLASGTFVDLDEGGVLDVDPSMPGFTFLRLPGRPGEIVTSPGGAASFVGVTSIGREGVVALPTSCMGVPSAGDAETSPGERRDITSFPACSLPVAPGDMAVLIDAPTADGSVALSCDRSLGAESGASAGATRTDCAADLTAELGTVGRRKLVVALPDLGQLAVLDAQALLDREPGTYAPCDVEAWVELAVDLPATTPVQALPPDLTAAGCESSELPAPPRPATFRSRPAGFALSDDGRLYIADHEAPVVHVFDGGNPCQMAELPPLLPVSFESPERVVTTSQVSVSPLTPSGKRFVYAIDELDQPAASVMAFDVSPGSTERTPVVRPGAPRLPLEPADRIGFSSAAVDVGFALRDLPASDPSTGVASTGLLCDPDPALGSDAAAAQYRPSTDFTSGARPELLRGLFGFVMLSSGQVAVIDVEDFDAPCRRPAQTNASDTANFRGCAGDEGLPESLTVDEIPTVTNEVSCNVVEPHRARAALLALNDARVGVHAPTLRAFPQFSTPDPSAQNSIAQRPKLLGVPFSENDPALVYIGSDLYQPDSTILPLDLNPLTAQQNSVTLPLEEPRAFAAEEAFTLTFEGPITAELPSGFFDLRDGETTLEDASANFCDRGVYSVELMRELGAEQFGLGGAKLEAFARRHADYVQITDDFPDEEEAYWGSPRGQECGGRETCAALFGPHDARDLGDFRELSVLEAHQGRLRVRPRNAENDAHAADLAGKIDCCFPTGVSYTLRASQQWVLVGSVSGFRHDVVASQTGSGDPSEFRCVRDCSPRKKYYRPRAFELSASDAACDASVPAEECPIGRSGTDDVVCSYDASAGPVSVAGAGAECIASSLTSRFAVYRGAVESQRDMLFSWTTAGGFRPLAMSLTAQSQSVLPQSMLYLPELQHLAVVDASTLGLTLLSLDSLRVEAAFY